MTGEKFERVFCELLKEDGYWALRIPKNNTGAQPFDILAISGDSMLAVDCKVCKSNRFPLSRIEDNQWLAFKMLAERTNARIGIAVYHNGQVFMIPYGMLLRAAERNCSSIEFGNTAYAYVLFCEREVEKAIREL